MQKISQRLKEQWPVVALVLAVNLDHPLQERIGIPLWLTYSVFGLVYVGWFALYAVKVWRQTARDKQDLEEKAAAADAQLFGCKTV